MANGDCPAKCNLMACCTLGRGRLLPRKATGVTYVTSITIVGLYNSADPLYRTARTTSLNFFSVRDGHFSCRSLRGLNVSGTVLPSIIKSCAVYKDIRGTRMTISVNSGRTNILTDVASGRVLLGVNADKRVYLVSTCPGFSTFHGASIVRIHPFFSSGCVYVKTSLYNNGTLTALTSLLFRVRAGLNKGTDGPSMCGLVGTDTRRNGKDLGMSATFLNAHSGPGTAKGVSRVALDGFGLTRLSCDFTRKVVSRLCDLCTRFGGAGPRGLIVTNGTVHGGPILHRTTARTFNYRIRRPLSLVRVSRPAERDPV